MAGKTLRLGFLGFGEAGYHFARGLSQAGLSGIVAYSRSGARSAPGDPLRKRAAEAGVELIADPRTLCERAQVIVAVTQGQAALPALRSVLPHLSSSHIYVDASTASVRDMEKAARLLEGRAGFVDAAIMGTVPLNGIKVLTVASGSHARRFHALLAPYGMNIGVLGGRAGAASAMKLIRSVFMKGLAGLLFESLEAAHRHGILEAVAADIAGSIDERPFAQNIRRFVCGTAMHAQRRVHEMGEVLALLQALGGSTRMTRATRAMISDIARMQLGRHFGGHEPKDIRPVIEAVAGMRGRTRTVAAASKGGVRRAKTSRAPRSATSR
jgi:3-hydroxyisobutyrate dehydrogenase-like beta-hydroxyacid dehydrogenase